jgi:mycothiol synthase
LESPTYHFVAKAATMRQGLTPSQQTAAVGWTIAVARADEWPAALELALQHIEPAQRSARVSNALALLAAGDLDPAAIFVARASDAVVGAQVAALLAGASGLVWLPAVTGPYAATDLADHLVAAAVTSLRSRGAKFVQALVEPQAAARAAPLVRQGFRHITELRYLERDLADLPAEPAIGRLRLESFSAANEDLFRTTLLHTYEGTLDCPELDGLRTIEEIIQGHQAQGSFRPANWRLAFLDDQPAGVLLLTLLEDGSTWDMSYLGVGPEFRRRGVGRALAVHALRKTHDAGALRLLVAVDARNLPALALYQSLGFQETGRREVYLRFF